MVEAAAAAGLSPPDAAAAAVPQRYASAHGMRGCRCRRFARLQPALRPCPDGLTPCTQGAAIGVPRCFHQPTTRNNTFACREPDAEWATISAPACRSLRLATPLAAVPGRVTAVPPRAVDAPKASPACTCAQACGVKVALALEESGSTTLQQALALVCAPILHSTVSTPACRTQHSGCPCSSLLTPSAGSHVSTRTLAYRKARKETCNCVVIARMVQGKLLPAVRPSEWPPVASIYQLSSRNSYCEPSYARNNVAARELPQPV